jgi:hypothetical protein
MCVKKGYKVAVATKGPAPGITPKITPLKVPITAQNIVSNIKSIF